MHFPSRRSITPHLLVAPALLLLAFAVRTINLGGDGLWYDEAYTAIFARKPLLDIIGGAARLELNTPLHYLLLKFWSALGGESEFTLRLLSVFAGVVTTALAAQFPFDNARMKTAAVALAALWPVAIDLSQELRMYALGICLSTASVVLLLRAMRRNARGLWLAWAAITLAAFGTHVLAALVFAAQLPILLRWITQQRASHAHAALRATLATGTAMALCVTALAVMRSDYGTTFTPRLDFAHTLLSSVAALTLPGLVPTEWIPVAALLSALLIAAALSAPRTRAAACIGAAATLLIAVFCVLNGKFAARYVAFAQPIILAAACGVALPRRAAIGAFSALLALAAAGAVAVRSAAPYANTDFAGAARFLRSTMQPNEAVLLVSGHAAPALEYYWPAKDAPRWHPLPADAVLDVRNTLDYDLAAPALDRALIGKSGAWLLLWQDDVVDPAFTVRTLLQRRSTHNAHDRELLEFHGLRLMHFTFRDAWRPLPARTPRMSSAITPHGPDVGLQSIGCHLFEEARLHDAAFEIGCFWRVAPGSIMPPDLKVSLRLKDAAGRTLAQSDQPIAPLGLPGIRFEKTILVFYSLPLPAETTPGPHTFEAVPYLPSGEITPLLITSFDIAP